MHNLVIFLILFSVTPALAGQTELPAGKSLECRITGFNRIVGTQDKPIELLSTADDQKIKVASWQDCFDIAAVRAQDYEKILLADSQGYLPMDVYFEWEVDDNLGPFNSRGLVNNYTTAKTSEGKFKFIRERATGDLRLTADGRRQHTRFADETSANK